MMRAGFTTLEQVGVEFPLFWTTGQCGFSRQTFVEAVARCSRTIILRLLRLPRPPSMTA